MNRPVVIGVGVAALVAATVLTWIDVRQQREFRRLIATGDAALARDQTFAAIEAFSGAMALRRNSMVPYVKRGDTYRNRGDLEAALRDLRRAAALDPTAPRPLELLGDVNEAMRQHARAVDYYRRYVALDDRAPRVLYKLAVALYRTGQTMGAIDPLRKAIAIDERFAEAHYLLGMCLRAGRQTEQARRALTRAVTLNPSLAASRQELADLYASLGRRREELEQLEALAALEPSRPERLVRVGLAYARGGRSDAAVVTLARAAERYPGTPDVQAALGRVWLDTAETKHDRLALKKAIDTLQPLAAPPDASSEALTLYGRALVLSGDARRAERVLQQAITRSPADPNAFEYLADAARRLGHTTIANEAAVQHAAVAP
jgi:tetratricopeptide (TPR) repeat protein